MHRLAAPTVSVVLLVFAMQCAIRAAAVPQAVPPRMIEVTAKKYQFDPAEIRVKKGEHVELKVHSSDETHGIKVEIYPEGDKAKAEPGLVFRNPEANGRVEKGVDQLLDFVAVQPGTYEIKCAKLCGMGHGHMRGKLVVEP